MALKTITGKVIGPDNNARGLAQIKARLSQPAAIPGTAEVLPVEVAVQALADGTYSIQLHANNDLTPNGTFYTILEEGGVSQQFTVVVPTSAGPFVMSQIMAAAPTPAPPAALDSAVVHLANPETITGQKTFSADPVFNNGAIPEAKVANLVTDLANLAADDANTVHRTGTEAIAGQKTFSGRQVLTADVVHSYRTATEAELVSGLDASLAETVYVNLTINRVMGAPINPVPGHRMKVVFTQPAGGNCTVTLPAAVLAPAWTLNLGASAITELNVEYNGTTSKWILALNPPIGKVTDIGGVVWDVTAPKYGAGDISKVTAAVSTAGINAAIIDAFNAGGGTVWLPPQPNGYGLIRYLTNAYAQKGGGILLLPRVSLAGQSTKLLLRDNTSFITNKGAHNYLPTIATMQASVAMGDTNILVDSSAGFVVGDNVYVSPSQNRYDTTSSGPGFFALIQSIPDATHLTIDRPIQGPMFVTAPAAPTLADGGAGNFPVGTYTFGFTYVYGSGAPNNETEVSPTTPITFATPSHIVNITGVALPTGVYATNWYLISNTGGLTNGRVASRTNASNFSVNIDGASNPVAPPDFSIAMSTPVDGGYPANGGNYWRRIIRLDTFYNNCTISGFDLINDIANGGGAEYGIDLRFARNIQVSNVTGQDIGAGYQASFSDGVTFKNWEVRQCLAQSGAVYRGRGAGDYNNNRQTWEDGKIQAFDTNALFVESHTKQVQFKKLRIVNNTTNARLVPEIIFTGQEAEVEINGLLVEGYGGVWQGQSYDLTGDGNTPSYITIKDLEMRLSQDWRTCRLDILSGKLILGPASPVAGYYLEAKRFSKRFALTTSMATVDVGLPAGLIKRCKIYLSTLTGITYFAIGSVDKTGALIESANLVGYSSVNQNGLVAGKMVDFTYLLGRIGTNYPANNSGQVKKTHINSDTTVPAGAYGVIEMEYFEQINPFPSTRSAILSVDDSVKGRIEDGGLLPGASAIGDFQRSTQTTTPTGASVTYTPDSTKGELQEIIQGTTAQALTIAAPANRVKGQFHTFKFVHFADAVAWVFTWNAVYKRAGGAFANTNTSGAVDTITFYDDGTNLREVGRALALA